MGSVPPVDSIRISDQNTPVEICTDATFDMAMLSSLLPNSRDFTRVTRGGLTTRRVGKNKLPCVQRLALKLSDGELSIWRSGFTPIPGRPSSKSRYSQRSECRGKSASQPSQRSQMPLTSPPRETEKW